jgi:hypothetical protein
MNAEERKQKAKECNKKYHQEHKQERNEKSREYHQGHKKEIMERKNKKMECSICGGKYTYAHEALHKRSKQHKLALGEDWTPTDEANDQKHKEYYQKYNKEYQEKHKKEIMEWRTKKNECSICGGKFTNAQRVEHTRSKKHQLALSNNPSSSTD